MLSNNPFLLLNVNCEEEFMGKSYEEIRNGANIFATATKALDAIGTAGLEQMEQTESGKALAQMMLPAIVLKAFSCELALKALAAKNQEAVGSVHKLNELYQKINKDTQKEISAVVIAVMKETSPEYSDVDFTEDLNKVAKVFIDWRYYYENSRSLNFAFLHSFFYAVLACL